MTVSKHKVIISMVLVTALAVIAVFYWLEARKEVVFLCGNFTQGVSQSSVLRQLQTGNLLRYEIQKVSTGSRINVDSVLGFGAVRCVIEFDLQDRVIQAVIE